MNWQEWFLAAEFLPRPQAATNTTWISSRYLASMYCCRPLRHRNNHVQAPPALPPQLCHAFCCCSLLCVCTHKLGPQRGFSYRGMWGLSDETTGFFNVYSPLVSTGFCWCSWWPLLEWSCCFTPRDFVMKFWFVLPFSILQVIAIFCAFSRAAKPDPNSVSIWFFLFLGPFKAGMALLQQESWVSSGPSCSVCSPLPVLDSHCPVVFYTYLFSDSS